MTRVPPGQRRTCVAPITGVSVSPWVVTRTIAAPIDRVFETVADINQFSRAIPHIVKVEFLSAQRSGVGTRFRETRLMKGKETATELAVTELVKDDRVRLVADTHGMVWDSMFQVRRAGDGTELTLTMDARPPGLVPRLMMLLIRGMVQRALEADMDSVKLYCEREGAA